ncbi:hypothetical protein [Brevundimonas sp.]|uniref:hypothetical protein n=1 Tax=Brevundimonas sp. TaxID=1871086 RepID=UPI003B00495A
MSITMRLPMFSGIAIILGLFAAEADAGDWRELARKDGIAIAVDALGMRRDGDKLSVDLVLAMLPERQLPIYGLGALDIDCATREASVSGIQYHLANGDTFGARTGKSRLVALTPTTRSTAFAWDGFPPVRVLKAR